MTLEACARSSLAFALGVFFFCLVLLNPFTVISGSYECNYMLSLVSPPSESQNVGGLGDPDTMAKGTFQMKLRLQVSQLCNMEIILG